MTANQTDCDQTQSLAYLDSHGEPPMTRKEAQARVDRMYASKEGPLMAWLADEAKRRGHDWADMASCLRVTVGYIYQLRTGIRLTSQISHEFARSCAQYLGVPPILVKLIAGNIRLSDFCTPVQTEEDCVERAFEQLMKDPEFRPCLPQLPRELSFDAKKSLVMLYTQKSDKDLLGYRQLPKLAAWLQRAAMIHDDNDGRGHEAKMNQSA